MKKLVNWICVGVALLLAGVSLFKNCEYFEEECPYTSYICRGSEVISAEHNPWDGWQPESEAPRDMTVEFLGTTYTGELQSSEWEYGNPYPTDVYYAEDAVLTIRRDKKEKVGYYRREKEPIFQYGITKAEAVRKADEIAGAYINVGEYWREVKAFNEYETLDKADSFNIYYGKSLSGVVTQDFVNIIIRPDGAVRQIRIGDIGGFDALDESSISPEHIEKSIQNCMKNINSTGIRYEIQSQKLTYTPQGKPVVLSEVSVQLKSGNTQFNCTIGVITDLEKTNTSEGP